MSLLSIVLIIIEFIINWIVGVKMTATHAKHLTPEQHDDNYTNDRRKIFHPSMYKGND